MSLVKKRLRSLRSIEHINAYVLDSGRNDKIIVPKGAKSFLSNSGGDLSTPLRSGRDDFHIFVIPSVVEESLVKQRLRFLRSIEHINAYVLDGAEK